MSRRRILIGEPEGEDLRERGLVRLLLRLRGRSRSFREDCAGSPGLRGHLFIGREEGEPSNRVLGKECMKITDEDRSVVGEPHAISVRRHNPLPHPVHPVHPEGRAVPAGADDDEDIGGERRTVRESEEFPQRVGRHGPAVQVHGACRPRMPPGFGRERHHADDLPDGGQGERTGHPRNGAEQVV